MSKRAEEVALKTYPDKEVNGVSLVFSEQRRLFQEGYELAEKDLALTWKDMKRISRILDIMVDDDFKGEIPEEWGEEEYYEEVLRRFNKAKKE